MIMMMLLPRENRKKFAQISLCFLLLLIFVLAQKTRCQQDPTNPADDEEAVEEEGEKLKELELKVDEEQEPHQQEEQSELELKPPVPAKQQLSPGNIVYLTVYMEAQCPDTTGFIRRQLLPSWSRLGSTNRLNVSIVPFGKASCATMEDGEGEDDFKCECQHGKDECELNQLMNCAIELLPDPESHIPLIGCVQGKDNLIAAFKSCLSEHSSSDWLWKCTVGKQGRRLHAAAGNRTAALGDDFNFVPWVVLDGQRENDAFYALEENVCKRLQQPRPMQCAKFEGGGKNSKRKRRR